MHALGIVRASDGRWLANTSVDMATCMSDVLGFCYSAPLATPVALARGEKYYVVSSEARGGDAFVEMQKSATGADYNTYRDGDTLMTYRLPTGAGAAPMAAGHSLVSGKVMREASAQAWTELTTGPDMDTSFGPVNLILQAAHAPRLKTEDEALARLPTLLESRWNYPSFAS